MVTLNDSSFSSRNRIAAYGTGYRGTQRQGWNAGKPGVSSHNERPRPGRRRSHKLKGSCPSTPTTPKPSIRKSQVFLLSLLLALSLVCSPAAGTKTYGDRQRSAVDRIVQRGELLVDRSPPPLPPRMRLERRHNDEASSSTIDRQSSILPSSAASGSATGAASGTPATTPTTIISADPSPELTPPQPFDTSLGNNFTSPSCPNFIRSFRDNSTFLSCLPLSLLLQTSSSFFQVTKSLVRTTQTLDASCNVDFNMCSSIMAAYGRDIVQSNNCGADYQNRHPMVLQAYNGFIAYQPLYQAGCLRDATGNYCFANAITNTTSNTDSYPYYLPLGVALPGGSRPTCNKCLQDTMVIFNTAAANKTQPVSQTYREASQQINMGCGPEFANTTVASAAPALGMGGGLAPLVALLVALYTMLL